MKKLFVTLVAVISLSAAANGLQLKSNTGSSSWDTNPAVTQDELRQRFVQAGELILPGMTKVEVQAVIGKPPIRTEGPHTMCGKPGIEPTSIWCNTAEVYQDGVFGKKYSVAYNKVHGAVRLSQQNSKFYKEYTKFSCSFVINASASPRKSDVLCLNSYTEGEK